MVEAFWLCIAVSGSLPELVVTPDDEPTLAAALAEALAARLGDVATVRVGEAKGAWRVDVRVAGDVPRLAIRLVDQRGEVAGAWPAIGDGAPADPVTLRLAAVSVEGRLRHLLMPKPEPPPPPASGDDAWRAYRAKRLVVGSRQSFINTGGGWFTDTSSVVREGEYGLTLAWADFFRKVGRPELVDAAASRSRLKLGVEIGGYAALLGAAVMGTVTFQKARSEGAFNGPLIGATVGTLVLGVVGTITGSAMREQPLDDAELGTLVEAHNDELRRQLGVR